HFSSSHKLIIEIHTAKQLASYFKSALIPRRAGPNGDFSATRHFQIVATFNEDRAGPGADADGRADGRAFTTAGDCADEGANRAADRPARHRTPSLAARVR